MRRGAATGSPSDSAYASAGQDDDKTDRRRPSMRNLTIGLSLLGFCVIASFWAGFRIGGRTRSSLDGPHLAITSLDSVEARLSHDRLVEDSPAARASLPVAQSSLSPPQQQESSPPPVPNREPDEMPAALDSVTQTCLSLNREPCPPLNLSIQTLEQQRDTHRRCGKHVAFERNFRDQPRAVTRSTGRIMDCELATSDAARSWELNGDAR